jgi:hypothetical protein
LPEIFMKDPESHKGYISEIETLFALNYPKFQYAYIHFLSEHLAECSREFGGDLQQLLIIAVLGQVAIDAHVRGVDPRADAAPDTSASRLADVCGIPRETVRRKLRLLEQKNWVRNIRDQLWAIAFQQDVSTARRDLADLDRRGIERVARMYAALERLVQSASEDDGGRRAEPAAASMAASGERARVRAGIALCLNPVCGHEADILVDPEDGSALLLALAAPRICGACGGERGEIRLAWTPAA